MRRPIATALLAIAIALAGMLAYASLPVAPLPNVDSPTILVQASLPGASPETMASSVATPLERRFGRIAGLNEMTSSSALGSTTITLQFDLDRDVDAAARDVQAAINAAGGELPADLPTRPSLRKVNPADAPTLILSVRSDTLPLSEVYDSANSILAQRISQVEGVGQVTVGGGQQPAVRVAVDPGALAASSLSTQDVRQTINLATSDMPKGSLSGDFQSKVVDANDQLFGADAFRSLVVSHDGTSSVTLGDVATVVDGVENSRIAGWVDGQRAVLIIVRREPGANIIETNERVKALLPELRSSISPAIDVGVAMDRTETIRASLHGVETAMLIAIGLVILVVFVFLRSVRATAIPSVAVPLSLLGTLGVMYLAGFNLDNLSLMALTISTGFVVDDAIVVTENITRHIEAGETPFAAALRGAKEISFTIISITVSLLAVFIPILLMGGYVGRIFREFAVTLAVAIAVSAVLSLTLTPMMCAHLLRPGSEKPPGRLFRFSERAFDWLLSIYSRALKVVLRHRRLTLVVTLATIVATLALYVVIPKGLFPQQDTGQITGTTEAAQDVSFGAMRAHQEEINAVLQADPDVDHVVSFIGSGGGNTGTVFIALKPGGERKSTSEQIIQRLRRKLASSVGIQTYMQSIQDVRLGGRFTKTQYQYTLVDADLDKLREWSPKLLDALKHLPELKDVTSDQQSSALELDLHIDRDTASRLGISAADVDGALYDVFGQRQIATTFNQRGQYRVVLEQHPERVFGPDALSSVYLESNQAGAPTLLGPVNRSIPLSMLVSPSFGTAPLAITHQGQFPSTTLSFNLAPGASLGTAVDAVRRTEREIGIPASMRASFSGTAQAFTQSLSNQPLLIALALGVMYVVLGMLYESFVHPITILSTLPSAGLGALLALVLMKMDLSVIALIGIILLVGIVKKNAIMMVDFALDAQRGEHLTPEEAIERACHLRFRPILMTTFAALLGALPLALDRATGAELRQPLGIAIVGGLLVSQLLTLFTTPVVFLALSRKKARGSH
ncbi:MAG: MMPL family transporter [Polyangiaceae bacterium]|nr:MMPL family transporter [Polyangiaceae bacterium]